jgi:hypothetical protein
MSISCLANFARRVRGFQQKVLSPDNPDDRITIVQMNAELRHAQLELLSAELATHQLRLRYSGEDIARFAEREVLNNAIRSAGMLHEYFASLPKQVRAETNGTSAAGVPQLTGEQVLTAINCLSGYFREQRNIYYQQAIRLNDHYRAMMQPFFSAGLLERTRVMQLSGTRIALPTFYGKARSWGFDNLPDIQHVASMAFLDVVVFNEKLNERDLFHALVHAVQFNILGVELYCDFYVRAFLRTNVQFTIPLEAHAFALSSRFAQNRTEGFSVEGQVRLWMQESRY